MVVCVEEVADETHDAELLRQTLHFQQLQETTPEHSRHTGITPLSPIAENNTGSFMPQGRHFTFINCRKQHRIIRATMTSLYCHQLQKTTPEQACHTDISAAQKHHSNTYSPKTPHTNESIGGKRLLQITRELRCANQYKQV